MKSFLSVQHLPVSSHLIQDTLKPGSGREAYLLPSGHITHTPPVTHCFQLQWDLKLFLHQWPILPSQGLCTCSFCQECSPLRFFMV